MEEKKKESKHQKIENIYWSFTNNWWCLLEIGRLLSNKEKESVNSFDYMIADMESNKNLSPKVTELFLKGKTSIFHLFFFPNLIFKHLKL